MSDFEEEPLSPEDAKHPTVSGGIEKIRTADINAACDRFLESRGFVKMTLREHIRSGILKARRGRKTNNERAETEARQEDEEDSE